METFLDPFFPYGYSSRWDRVIIVIAAQYREEGNQLL